MLASTVPETPERHLHRRACIEGSRTLTVLRAAPTHLAAQSPQSRAPGIGKLACSIILASNGFVALAAPPLSLQLIMDVPLGGNPTRLDYASLDAQRHLLFIAHLGDSAVIVFDTEANRVLSRIEGLSKIHGVLVVPELGTVYATATGTNEVVAIDETTLKITARAAGGIYPDGMAYAPVAHKLYVSDEHGGTETVIDVRTNSRVATIALGGAVGNSQYDPVTGHVFANVQTRRQLIEIDPATDRVIARIDLPGAEGNHGLLIEPQHHRAFIACEHNNKLLVLDLETRKLTATFEVGESPDVLAYDPGLGLLYVAAESGVVSFFRAGRGQIAPAGAVLIGPNAHVVVVDPASHRIFFPLRNLSGRTMLRIMTPAR
jgi:YVTN family beta-propeller protein